MKIIRGLKNYPCLTGRSVVAIGNFDGVHLGHQALLRTISERATQEDLSTVVIIFEPQPLEWFCPEQAPARLTPFHEKIRIFEKWGVDYVLCLPFDRRLSALTPQSFIETCLMRQLNTAVLFVGEDFRFGYQRQGDIHLLATYARQGYFDCVQIPTVSVAGDKISSTLIRQALSRYDFEYASQLLGRPYAITQRVRRGDQRGRTLGFPTLNLLIKHPRLVLSGVFAVEVRLPSGASYQGVANLGLRPTVNGTRPQLEAHLFGFNQEIYGQMVTVIMRQFIRAEQRFPNLEALQAQIQQDVSAARQFFAHNEYAVK